MDGNNIYISKSLCNTQHGDFKMSMEVLNRG
jgi:hypothetical protein